jgi:hypothetical protein
VTFFFARKESYPRREGAHPSIHRRTHPKPKEKTALKPESPAVTFIKKIGLIRTSLLHFQLFF